MSARWAFACNARRFRRDAPFGRLGMPNQGDMFLKHNEICSPPKTVSGNLEKLNVIRPKYILKKEPSMEPHSSDTGREQLPEAEPLLMTEEEIARSLRVSRRHLVNLRNRGDIPYVPLSKRRIGYRREAVLKALILLETTGPVA